MIIPITTEAEWQAALSATPLWVPPLVPTVVIAPHPDDETLAAGGLIAYLRERKVPVSVIAVTDGENAYEGESALGAVRELEQAAALKRLGVPVAQVSRLRFTDSAVASREEDLTAAMLRLLSDAGHIVAPWPGDFHPDHEATGKAALTAAHRLGIPLSFYFFWTWHRGTPELLKELSLHKLPLTRNQQEAKREALALHVSQLHHHSGAPILPEELLQPALRSYEVFLPS